MIQNILLLVLSFINLFFQKNEKKEITFLSQDNLTITADLYAAKATSKPILLCHQAEFSRGEYLEIAPELVKLGFTCLAIDQRSGKDCKGIKNRTNEEAVKKRLKTNFLDAQKDIEASIDYMFQRFQQPVIVFGSSYSASLALKIASENKKVRAVIAFSPGEYFKDEFSVLESCSAIKQPVFISGSKTEMNQMKDYLNDSPSRTKQLFIPNSNGTHGAKVLWTNSADKLEYWQALKEFFDQGSKILVAMEEGLVIKSTGSWYDVLKNDKEIIQCRIKGNIRLKGIKNTNPVTVGDSVDIEQSLNGEWMIADIHPRKNYIIRKSINLSKKNQIIASNIDFAFLIVTLKNPRTSFGFIDRFLVTAEAYSIKPILVLNKMDLYDKSDELLMEGFEYIYSRIGYKILKTSIVSNEGIEELKKLVSQGTSMFSGHSGVGKSSLLNAIEKDLDLRTGKISDVHSKGKHTTTFAEMILLKSGGRVIDTPGIKELGIVDLEKHEIRDFFPEMQQISHLCKFNNCLHINEPGCKILSAVEDETISESRYLSYLSIFQNELMEEKDYTS